MNANTRVISVIYWNVNKPSEFMKAVNEFHNAMKEKEGVVREYWFSTIGRGPLERWASFDIDNGYWFSNIGSEPYGNQQARARERKRSAIDEELRWLGD